MHRVFSMPIVAALAALIVSITPRPATAAPVFYEFVQTSSGDTLATLEFSAVPVTSVTQINALTFTAAGDAIFGFGPAYGGTFDTISGTIIDNGGGTLQPAAPATSLVLFSLDPPAEGVLSGTISSSLTNLSISWRSGGPAGQITANGRLPSAPFITSVDSGLGEWHLVPEPTSGVFLAIAAAGFMSRRRR